MVNPPLPSLLAPLLLVQEMLVSSLVSQVHPMVSLASLLLHPEPTLLLRPMVTGQHQRSQDSDSMIPSEHLP